MKKDSNARWHAWGGMLATVGGLVAAGVAIWQMRSLGIPVLPALSGGASLLWIALALLLFVGLVAFAPSLVNRLRHKRAAAPPPNPLRQNRREGEGQDAVAAGEGERRAAKVTPLDAARRRTSTQRPPAQRKRH